MKKNSILGDALLNATGLRNLAKTEETPATEPINPALATEDDLEDIPESAPAPEPEKEPAHADDLEDIPDEKAPEKPEPEEKPAEPITAPEPAIESKLDQRTKDYVLDLLHTEKDLRVAAREVLKTYEEADRPDEFVWVYKAKKGPNKGKTFIGEEQAAESISEEARAYVEFKEIFVKYLYKLDENGQPTIKATKAELDAYLASENANPQPAADDQSGTNTAG